MRDSRPRMERPESRSFVFTDHRAPTLAVQCRVEQMQPQAVGDWKPLPEASIAFGRISSHSLSIRRPQFLAIGYKRGERLSGDHGSV